MGTPFIYILDAAYDALFWNPHSGGLFTVAHYIVSFALGLGLYGSGFSRRRRPREIYKQWLEYRLNYGSSFAFVLVIWFPDALNIAVQIQRVVLPGEPSQALAFIGSFSSSFTAIGVASAIVTQVAITALSLDHLAETHWTVGAFFIVSLTSGAPAVFFSCVLHPVILGLHTANDVKDWLSKPFAHRNRRTFQQYNAWLDQYDNHRISIITLAKLTEPIAISIEQDTHKVASAYSAMMLVAPARLLCLSLSTFMTGLMIYLSFVYASNLISSFGASGSLVILIVCAVTITFAHAMFYVPEELKTRESELLLRFREESERIRLLQQDTGMPSTGLRQPKQQSKASIPDSSNSRTRSTGEVFNPENIQLKDLRVPPISVHPHHEQQATQTRAAQDDNKPNPPTFEAVFEEFILVQEQSIQAARKLLQSYQTVKNSP